MKTIIPKLQYLEEWCRGEGKVTAALQVSRTAWREGPELETSVLRENGGLAFRCPLSSLCSERRTEAEILN